MKRSIQALLVASMLLLGNSCGEITSKDVAPQRRPVQIEVRNDNWADAVVRISAASTGNNRRLGRVGSLSSDSYTSREPASGAFVFTIRLFGSNTTLVTEPITAQAGDIVVLRIHPNLDMSTVYRRD